MIKKKLNYPNRIKSFFWYYQFTFGFSFLIISIDSPTTYSLQIASSCCVSVICALVSTTSKGMDRRIDLNLSTAAWNFPDVVIW